MSRTVIVALHGVGSAAGQLAAALAALGTMAEVVALDGPEPFSGGGDGRQWFSIAGVTEANRPQRVIQALPPLIGLLDGIAAEHGMARDELVLLGFSQGAIMALAAVAQGAHNGRAIAIAGRLAASIVPAAGAPASVLLVHDADDPVMPIWLFRQAGEAFVSAGHDVTQVQTEGLGHSIGPATLAAIAEWLTASACPRAVRTLSEG
ncbi:MAG: hypothetical protein EPO45_03725 [Sphingobium sp.]|nr:MAG: hypothetical protein EPO45_03725 [Sphingobium sp.]